MPICPNCGTATDGDFCPECGSRVTANTPAPAPQPEPQPAPQPQYQQPAPQYTYNTVQTPAAQPLNVNVMQQRAFTEADLPEKFRPLSAWAYFGLTLLFSIPIVGFIFLIVYSFNDSNRNRRSFARSYWCWLVILAVLAGVALIIALILAANKGTDLSGLFKK